MFIPPKPKHNVPLSAKVSHDAMVIFREYATYTGFSLDELFVEIADKLLEDPQFIESVKHKRGNKKIMEVLKKKEALSLIEGFREIDDDDLFFSTKSHEDSR